MTDAKELAAGIALGILATLAVKGLVSNSAEPKEHSQPIQSDLRVLRAKLYGMTPDQLDKYDLVSQTGYVPQSRNAILESFASLPRPSRADSLKHLNDKDKN